MSYRYTSGNSALAVGLFELLNPIPFGFFVAAWLFDIIYISSYEILWTEAASWLITFGLFLAIIPRLINLVQVWFGKTRLRGPGVAFSFWANLLAIILAIVNAFIHSRDSYAVVPAGVILSTLVVLLLAIANVQLALRERRVA